MEVSSKVASMAGARSANTSYGYPVWISDDLLAYTMYVVTPPSEDSDIYSYSFSENKQKALVTQSGSQDFASVSPGGDRIVYMSSTTTSVSGFGATITQQMWMASLRTGKVEELIPGSARDTRPKWSPDGQRIAFSSDRGGGNPEIWVLEIDSRALTQLTTGPGEKTDPCWSPDGDTILYVSTASGRHELNLLDVKTRKVKALHPFGSKNVEIRDPSWGR